MNQSATDTAVSTHSSESSRMVVITLTVIVVETVALGLAAWSSGSAALFALTAQSVAGLVVEGLLLIGSLRSGRPADDRHPLGYGREAFFWSLFAALAIFLGGGALSLGEAWRTLGEEPGQGSYGIEYAVLVGVLIANVWSLRMVSGPVARSRFRSFVAELRRTSDPILVTVVLDNATSVAGTVFALLGLALHQATGAPIFDALASAGIGVLLIVVAAALLARGCELITGPAIAATTQQSLVEVVEATTGVNQVVDLKAVVAGPRQIVVMADVAFDRDLDVQGVEAVTDSVMAAVRETLPVDAHVSLTPRSPYADSS
jgi:cation diffusion facilitator family transporter